MESIIGFLITKGLSPKLARIVAIGGLFVLILSVMAGAKCAYDRNLIRKHDDAQEIKLQRKIAPANDKAAEARATDTIAIAETERKANEAIQSAPETAPSPASTALGCDRLRRAGKDITRYPACR